MLLPSSRIVSDLDRNKGIDKRTRFVILPEFHCRAYQRIFQSIQNSIIYRIENQLVIGKFDLKLCRMHIDIHKRWMQAQIHHAAREFFRRYVGSERLFKG